MNFEQVESAVKKLSRNIKKESFIYDFLLAFGTAKSTITMLKNGSRNLSKKENEIICKKKILFSVVNKDVESEFKKVLKDKSSFKHDPRFIVVTDHETLYALDTKLDDKINFDLKDIQKKFDFFLPLAEIEKKEFQHENPVDVKAAEKLAKLFDLIKLNNPSSDDESLHSLNVFLTRLLFCYFAEDTDIFPQGIFTKNITSHTQSDGSDLSRYFKRIFAIMNIEKRPNGIADSISAFPYVNGGLFAENHPIPTFCNKSRSSLLEIGDLDWAEINPDIFGSMIQAVVHPDQRAGLGMHYTSVNNIMKVIEPLFLNDLYVELDKSKQNIPKLKKLLKRISEIKIFDPACGSGNFLIIAYKELRKLEMKVYNYLPGEMKFSYIPLSNFYGIEIDDFAHEVAILSLWLTEHQMDIMFAEEFGEVKASLPLKDGGNIICGNSLRMIWDEVCPFRQDEIYVLGNPPYLGATYQDEEQKKDMQIVFGEYKQYKKIDYIGSFFYKAASYIKNRNIKSAFVSTNSICQGSLVSMLWPKIFDKNIEISFAHLPFKWTNNARNRAGVTCIIVGLQNTSKLDKYLYDDEKIQKIKNINAYLIPGKNFIVKPTSKPISCLPRMDNGNKAVDGGHLILTDREKTLIVAKCPEVEIYLKKLMGSKEILDSSWRWCIWVKDSEFKKANKIKFLKERFQKVKEVRMASSDSGANDLAANPYRFRDQKEAGKHLILVPSVSSERRKYIPISFLDATNIVVAPNFQIFDADIYILGVISSRIHNVWVRTVSGQLESRVRYSSALCYNTFPFPKISKLKIDQIEKATLEIIRIRQSLASFKLSEMYDPDKMPIELIEAHENLDLIVDTCFRDKVFSSDSERLRVLLSKYKEMAEND